MLELSEAIARAALIRATVLRGERLTRAAQRILDELASPTGALPSLDPNPEQYSPGAYLRERYELGRALILMRQERPEAVEEARRLLKAIRNRVDPASPTPYLDGETRDSFLSDLATAHSSIGDEPEAIHISSQLVRKLVPPAESARLVEYVMGSADARRYKGRIAIQLNNQASRRAKLAFIKQLEGDADGARAELERGRHEGEQSLALRDTGDDPRAVSSRLLSRANLVRVQIETAVLEHGPEQRAAALESARGAAIDLVRESYAVPAVKPNARLSRAGLVGMVYVEQARELAPDRERAALAWMAIAVLKPNIELYGEDANEEPAKAIRYADAWDLAGQRRKAIALWSRSRERLAIYRGASAPAAIEALDRRIAAASG